MAITWYTSHYGRQGVPGPRFDDTSSTDGFIPLRSEPYTNHPANIGDSSRATVPVDDEEWFLDNQFDDPDPTKLT